MKLDWLAGERLPTAFVDLEAFDRNLDAMAELARKGRKKLRVASKSLRVPALIERVLARGEPFVGIMAYSAEECEFLAERGARDLLLAYPTRQKSDLLALQRAQAKGATVRLVVDHSSHLDGVPSGHSCVVEVDASLRLWGGRIHLGVRRSPIRTLDALMRLVEEIRSRGARFGGVMVYEAQIAGLGDRNRFRSWMNPAKALVRALSRRRVERLRAKIGEFLSTCPEKDLLFNGGGTGSLNWAIEESALTEVSAGSGLYQPGLFDYYSNIRFEPSAFFALQAVRSSDPGWSTCAGGGYVASGEPGWDKTPQPYWPQGLSLAGDEACGEVQTPVQGATIPPGSPVVFRHAKAGELMERFNEVCLIRNGQIVERVQTYRGYGKCFL